MARTYPALEVHWTHPVAEDDLDQMLAAVDEASPTAIEERDDGRVRLFFGTAVDRTRGEELLRAFVSLRVLSLDVSDEDWGARSQAGLGPVRVGRIEIVSTSGVETAASPVDPRGRGPEDIARAIQSDTRAASAVDPRGRQVISITPSMGFGTGHHASTRRCLALLQRVPVEGARVLDAGTGSGVLALAAWKLGAREVVAVDADPDALTAAAENLEHNGATKAIRLALVDLGRLPDREPNPHIRGPFDLVLANLTGSALVRYAPGLASVLSRTGRIIASGFQENEIAAVAAAFEPIGLSLTARDLEEGWVGVILT